MSKYILFFIALLFATIFVLSTLYGFIWQVEAAFTGVEQAHNVVLYTYAAFVGGLVGWVVSTIYLVVIDETDGVNEDDELDVDE